MERLHPEGDNGSAVLLGLVNLETGREKQSEKVLYKNGLGARSTRRDTKHYSVPREMQNTIGFFVGGAPSPANVPMSFSEWSET